MDVVAPAGPGWLEKQLRRATIWSFVFQLLSKGSLLITGAILARVLDVGELGAFSATQGLLLTGSVLFDFGISLWIERESSSGKLDSHHQQRYVIARMKYAATASLLVLVLAAFGALPPVRAIAIGCASAGLLVSTMTNAILQARLRYRASALTQAGARLLFACVVGGLSELHDLSLDSALLTYAGSEFILALAQLPLLFKLRRRSKRQLKTAGLRTTIRSSLPYWVSAVAFVAYNRADTSIVAFFAGRVEAGLYAPASLLQNALMIIPGGLASALPTAGAAAWSQQPGQRYEFLSRVKRLVLLTTAGSAVVSLIACLAAPLIISIYAGSGFEGAVTPMRILVWSLPFNAVEFCLVGLLVAMGKPRLTVWFYTTALVASLAAQAVLAPSFGAVGGAVASLMREPIAASVLVYLTVKEIRKR